MIYLDSSVALAEILSVDRCVTTALWNEELISSRLLQYEIWNRLHARGVGASHAEEAKELLEKVSLLELTPLILERALHSFPISVRTLDGLHLASLVYLRDGGQSVELASFDERLSDAAVALGIAAFRP